MYRKFIVIVIFAFFCLATSNASTPIRRCTEIIPLPNNVQINDCNTSPCYVNAGSIANMTIQFTAVNNNTESINAEVVAYVNGEAFPFQMSSDYADVCKHLESNAHCPLNAGDKATYSFFLPLGKTLPTITVDAEVAFVDENRNCFSCFVTEISVKEHKNPT